MIIMIETKHLILRSWKSEDAETYFQINQDPKVIALLRGPLTMQQARDFIHATNAHEQKHGYALWAACLKDNGEVMGFIGLNSLPWDAHFTPAVEIAWRLGSAYWNKGYATEGAKAALQYGFNQCQLKEIVSFTVPANVRSIRVMEKIGLEHDPDGDFPHPNLPDNHPLSKHVLYRRSIATP